MGEASVPVGYHFMPDPSELVKFYLRPRLLNQSLPCQVIKELNIYDFHPKDILGNTPAGKHLYFFTPRKMKYPNGTRPARGTNGGYWKASGKDIIIRDENKKGIGHKKFLVFHEGRQSSGRRTNWLMHEYTIKEFWFPTDQNKDKLGALALCEIYLKPISNKSRDGELQVDEEEGGSTSHSLDNEDIQDNIFVDHPGQARPASCNNGNDRDEALVAFTSACPLDSLAAPSPIMARPDPPMPSFMGYNYLQSDYMELIPRPSLEPSGLLQPEPAASHHLYSFDSEQHGSLVHPFYFPCMASTSTSSQSGNSDGSFFRNQMMIRSPRHMISPLEIRTAAASSLQYQVLPQRMPPLQSNCEASEFMPSFSETSPQTTLWPLPEYVDGGERNI